MSNTDPADVRSYMEKPVWGVGHGVRAFVSHKAHDSEDEALQIKKDLSKFKEDISKFGMTVFFATQIRTARGWKGRLRRTYSQGVEVGEGSNRRGSNGQADTRHAKQRLIRKHGLTRLR